MQISPIKNFGYVSYVKSQAHRPAATDPSTETKPVTAESRSYAKVPAGFQYGAQIHFGGETVHKSNRIVDISPSKYLEMSENTKKRYRIKCENFAKTVDIDELFDPKETVLPLGNKKDMDEFIKTSKIYLNYKDKNIVCLGRSPKWFLNAAQWMKDGIEPYKFTAFSKYWYRPDPREGMHRINMMAPTKEDITAYRKYLRRVRTSPQAMVREFRETGKKTVITDYISSGKGMTSFLEILADYAEEKGILEEFSKVIQIVGIGSMDYMESFYHDDEEIPEPRVIMPEKLRPYSKNIKQEFYNMDYNMFCEMLLNQNTNECRSTYYPHEAWTVYSPDRFKTGLVKDMRKIQDQIEKLKKEGGKKGLPNFTPAMQDFRNLLNFRILDALFREGELALKHVTKV